MGESGKLKLTGDMTELEMGLSSLLSTGQIQGARGGTRVSDIGEAYLALRAFRYVAPLCSAHSTALRIFALVESHHQLIYRQILFSPPSALSDPLLTLHLPPLIVMHHIIVLSPLQLPHEVQGWSEMEYYTWVQKHEDEGEQWAMVWKAIEEQVTLPPDELGKVEADNSGENGADGAEDAEEADVIAAENGKESKEKLQVKTQDKEKEPESEEDWIRLLRGVIKYAEAHRSTA
jgi:hypothetical protein